MPKDAHTQHNSAISLEQLPVGLTARVVSLSNDPQQRRRLMELGLPVGCLIYVTQQKGRSGLIVARNEARLAIGPALAKFIHVAPLN